MNKQIIAAVAILGVSAGFSPALAQQKNVKLGTLNCAIEGGTGFIIGSSKNLSCTFASLDDGQPPENYFGTVKKFGLDVGKTDKTLMQWAVLAPSKDAYDPGSLAGNYVGASAEATAGIGAGANVLVGGSGKSFALQPVSVQTQTGLNVAVGVTQFKLRSAAN